MTSTVHVIFGKVFFINDEWSEEDACKLDLRIVGKPFDSFPLKSEMYWQGMWSGLFSDVSWQQQ